MFRSNRSDGYHNSLGTKQRREGVRLGIASFLGLHVAVFARIFDRWEVGQTSFGDAKLNPRMVSFNFTFGCRHNVALSIQ